MDKDLPFVNQNRSFVNKDRSAMIPDRSFVDKDLSGMISDRSFVNQDLPFGDQDLPAVNHALLLDRFEPSRQISRVFHYSSRIAVIGSGDLQRWKS
ncbi:hypothetical protein [Hydrogenispora ethanolica]|uniref:hypothetical protein n=1 Tax=Hydrogenispora ethanolica TaxID=1082276 RepID=UPI00104F5C50|nr:hypothetical protein [Hydrogenispora ethanolica]